MKRKRQSHKTILDVVYAAIKAKDISSRTKEMLIHEYLAPKIQIISSESGLRQEDFKI